MDHYILDFAYTKEQADAYERYYIKKYKSNDPARGYNLTKGGKGTVGCKHPYNGVPRKRNPLSEETKKKISESEIGHPPIVRTEETIKNMSKGQKKPILCEETNEVFSDASEVAIKLNLNHVTAVHSACRSHKEYYGFHWKYLSKEEFCLRNMNRKDIIINPDEEFVKKLKKRLKDNGRYCITKRDKKPENKCPCRDFQTTGECICGLYIKVPTYEEEEE